MKKLLILLLALFISSNIVKAGVSPIEVKYNDGIYEIALKGEKIKKRVKFISSKKLINEQKLN